MAGFPSFLWLNNILLCVYMFYLPSYALKGISVVSVSWLLWIVLNRATVYMSVLVPPHIRTLILLCTYLGEESLAHTIDKFLIFWETIILFSQRRQWHPTPVLLPGKSHGWRSLVACSPWGAKSQTWLNDFTLTFHFHALEKEMATHCSILASTIPGTGEPGGLPSMGLHRVGHDWSDLAAAYYFP